MDPDQANHKAKRIVSRPFAALSTLMFAIGSAGLAYTLFRIPLILSATPLLISLSIIIAGLAIDRKQYTCGQCGNKILPTSTLCPACHAALKVPKPQGLFDFLITIGFLIVIALLVVYVVTEIS